MGKFTRNIIIALGAVSMALVITACGSGGSSDKKSKSDSPANTNQDKDVNAGYNALEPSEAMAKIDKSKSCLNSYAHTMDFTKHPTGHYQSGQVIAKFICTDADIKALLNTATGQTPADKGIKLKNLDIYLLNDVTYDVSSQYNNPAVKDAQRELDNVYIEGNTHTITLQGMNPDNQLDKTAIYTDYTSSPANPNKAWQASLDNVYRKAPLFNEVKGGSILSNVTVLVKDMVLIDGFIGTASQTTLNNFKLTRTKHLINWVNDWGTATDPRQEGLDGHFRAITDQHAKEEVTMSLIKTTGNNVELNNVDCEAVIFKGDTSSTIQGNKFVCLSQQTTVIKHNTVTLLELNAKPAEFLPTPKTYTP